MAEENGDNNDNSGSAAAAGGASDEDKDKMVGAIIERLKQESLLSSSSNSGTSGVDKKHAFWDTQVRIVFCVDWHGHANFLAFWGVFVSFDRQPVCCDVKTMNFS